MAIQSWHQLCTLRDDVRSGRLKMDEFAADLNGTRTGQAPAVYREATLEQVVARGRGQALDTTEFQPTFLGPSD